MKIYNNMNITYSAIEQNSRKNTKQNIPGITLSPCVLHSKNIGGVPAGRGG